MSDGPHDVVKLLLARMQSHPEEFKSHADRWDRVLLEVLEHGNEAEIAAIHASVRNIRLSEAHEDMMDELCNGEERRRKEAEEGATTTRYPTSTDMENNGIMGALRKLT